MLADFLTQHSSTLLIFLIAFLCIALVLWPQFRQRLLQKQSLATPFPAKWRKVLREQWPIYRRLPADLQMRLKKHIQLFLLEKQFVGCDGLVVTDEMRVLVAAQACLLTLQRPLPHYPDLSTILLYPQAFHVATQQQLAGVITEQMQTRLGESWQHGQVVLSWPHSKAGAANAEDGHNLVLHEFAHQLDQQTGLANGAPDLGSQQRYQQWSEHFSQAFSELQQQLNQQQATFLDPYAATNPAEFFAVATEAFFEQPQDFQFFYPKLYPLMQSFYQLDPRGWQPHADR
jgi:Mlc titration factor MtfA (ptsG expression regulator)